MNKLQKTAVTKSGIVLFAKQPGKTSFSSLYTIKHALGTKKVGHTGTLDSFACGLLVVCTGSLTRLASRITAFDKTYEAVVCFGTETDTLDPTGTVIKTAPLPSVSQIKDALLSFNGNILQTPPAFSAIHVNGKRASDLVRSGTTSEIPARTVTVYSSEILEMQLENNVFVLPGDFESLADEKVLYARIRCTVSKGTYIRSLARDIGLFCGSAAHLSGLLRTSVGDFSLADAAGAQFLPEFTIESVVPSLPKSNGTKNVRPDSVEDYTGKKVEKNAYEAELQTEVVGKIKSMDRKLASECGFASITLRPETENAFYNGKPLKPAFFIEPDFQVNMPSVENQAAVFTSSGVFAGIIDYNSKRISYGYVVPRPVMQ